MGLCALLFAGIPGAASASTHLRAGTQLANIKYAGLQLAQSERYRPSNPTYRPRNTRRRIYRPNNRNRYNNQGGYRSPPGSLNYGRGGGILPMGEVVPNVRRAVRGQVLRGGLRGSQYWFRVLTRDGRVVDVYADARTGRITSIRGAR